MLPFDVKLNDAPLTIVQPDLMIVCDKNKLDGKRCNGAPDFIIEIVSPGNPTDDYIRKAYYYESSGVREYWIVDPENRTVQVLLTDHKGMLLPHEEYGKKEVAKVNVLEGCFIELSKVFPE